MQRFGKASRLKTPEEFGEVRRRGTAARAGAIAVAALPAQRQRLGIVASRRVGNSVERNRIKRVVRDFFRKHGELFPVGDCVVIPATGAGSCDNDQIRVGLAKALALLQKKIGQNRGQTR